VRDAQRRHWTSVADAWAKWFDWTERNFAPLTGWLRDNTAWRSGSNLLAIGCGSGYPALAAGAAVGPQGHVTAIDLSRGMIDVASRRAAAVGLHNIEFHEMGAEALRFADETFDGATCVCAFMFSPEPSRAISGIRRVLKPHGRFGIVVWDEASRNPFSMTMAGVLNKFIALPPLPGAGDAGPFRFAAPGELEAVLRAGGCSVFSVENRAMTFEFPSVDVYVQLVSELTGWNRRLQTLSDDLWSQLRLAVTEAVAPSSADGCVRLDAAVHCVVGEKS
jgi:enediyne biosynthesis protein CalE5